MTTYSSAILVKEFEGFYPLLLEAPAPLLNYEKSHKQINVYKENSISTIQV